MTARALQTHANAHGPVADHVSLTYDARILRRKRLVTDHDEPFVVDLPQTTSVDAGNVFVLDDGRQIAVVAADEALMRVTGDLVRLAWHIGNRHAPCAILPDALVVQREKGDARDAGTAGRDSDRCRWTLHTRRRGLWPRAHYGP